MGSDFCCCSSALRFHFSLGGYLLLTRFCIPCSDRNQPNLNLLVVGSKSTLPTPVWILIDLNRLTSVTGGMDDIHWWILNLLSVRVHYAFWVSHCCSSCICSDPCCSHVPQKARPASLEDKYRATGAMFDLVIVEIQSSNWAPRYIWYASLIYSSTGGPEAPVFHPSRRSFYL